MTMTPPAMRAYQIVCKMIIQNFGKFVNKFPVLIAQRGGFMHARGKITVKFWCETSLLSRFRRVGRRFRADGWRFRPHGVGFRLHGVGFRPYGVAVRVVGVGKDGGFYAALPPMAKRFLLPQEWSTGERESIAESAQLSPTQSPNTPENHNPPGDHSCGSRNLTTVCRLLPQEWSTCVRGLWADLAVVFVVATKSAAVSMNKHTAA